MARLTKRVVDQLAPQPRDYFAWETELPGFGVRIFPSGRKSYLIQYRDTHGRTRRYVLGPHGVLTPDQARTLAQQALARVRAGANPAQERQDARQAPTVQDLAARFLRDHVATLRPGTQRTYRLALSGHILPALDTLAVPAVTRADIQALHQRLRATPYQANRVLALCATLFAHAEAWGLRPEGSNPARRIARYREYKRERFLTGPELARLGQVLARAERDGLAGRATVALLRLLILTGARLGEIQTLRWEWIDWRRAVVRLPESKSGAKTLYLAPAALAELRRLVPQSQGLVLPGTRPGKPRVHPHKSWRRLCAAADLTDLRPHDLRHTFASTGATLGLSLQVIGKLLGHADAATTQRYAHLAPDPVQQAAELVAEAIAKALGG